MGFNVSQLPRSRFPSSPREPNRSTAAFLGAGAFGFDGGAAGRPLPWPWTIPGRPTPPARMVCRPLLASPPCLGSVGRVANGTIGGPLGLGILSVVGLSLDRRIGGVCELAADRLGSTGREDTASDCFALLATSGGELPVGDAEARCAGFLATGGGGFPVLDCSEIWDVWDTTDAGR
jgi:hypothetical protein